MSRIDTEPSLHDEAARAGWLYYVGGMTQTRSPPELGVSRQRQECWFAGRRVEGLIHVRLNHRIGARLDLEAALVDRFGLTCCRVAPGLGAGADPVRAISRRGDGAGAVPADGGAFGDRPRHRGGAARHGDALEPMVEQHRLVSLIGTSPSDGSASFFDVVMRIADKVRAPHYPMPVPVISTTPEENLGLSRARPGPQGRRSGAGGGCRTSSASGRCRTTRRFWRT